MASALHQSNVQFFAEGHASHAAPRAAHPRDRSLAFQGGGLATSLKGEVVEALLGP